MRVIRFLIALAFLGLGSVIGALNRQPVSIDLAFGHLGSNLGIVMLACVLAGVLIGGLAITVSVVLPLRRRLSRVQRPPLPDLPRTSVN